jgi:hypothetical protein
LLFLLRKSVEQGWPAVFNLSVDQSRYSTHAGTMLLTMMTIHLGETPLTAQPTNAMFELCSTVMRRRAKAVL